MIKLDTKKPNYFKSCDKQKLKEAKILKYLEKY